jgi:hypothetical protein
VSPKKHTMLSAFRTKNAVLVYIEVFKYPKLYTPFDYTSEGIQGELVITHREASNKATSCEDRVA